MCRSRRELSNEYSNEHLLGKKIGFDQAENELSRVCRSKQAIPTPGHKSDSADGCWSEAFGLRTRRGEGLGGGSTAGSSPARLSRAEGALPSSFPDATLPSLAAYSESASLSFACSTRCPAASSCSSVAIASCLDLSRKRFQIMARGP